jgi:uncharacterized RDD family membrane protein YckC
MSEVTEREPVLLGASAGEAPPPVEAPPVPAQPAPARPKAPSKPSEPAGGGAKRAGRRDSAVESRGDPSVVHVAGFWQRLVGGLIDTAIILPLGLLFTWIAVSVSDMSLPPSRMRQIDFWVDQLLATNPVLMTGVVMILAVGAVYLLVFQILLGRTVGMRVMKMRIIDVWGDRPTIARCAARTAGYLVGVGTIALGFLWVGFDSEKRGLHDWIAGTYVIKA